MDNNVINTKRKKTKLEILMYVLAIVMCVICAFMIYSSIAYLSSYLSSYGMTFKSAWKDAIQSVVSSGMPWLAYAGIFFGIARVTKRLENIKPSPQKIRMASADAFPPAAASKEETAEPTEK
ncbi:MAG: hypothetical protein VB031_03885 [Eubacteriaceae bacterium]|nr:hypothetical protein [Eubacteriaceae bacterium]